MSEKPAKKAVTKKAAARVRLRYVGGSDSVTVVFPTGRSVAVSRDETVELLASEAAGLAGNQDWADAAESSNDQEVGK